MDNKASELLLIKKLLKNDYSALEELMNIYSRKLYYYCCSILKSNTDAEEVVQDTFIKIYKNIAKYNIDYKFSAWIYKIASNATKDKLRLRNAKGTNLTVSYSDIQKSESDSTLKDKDIPDSRSNPGKTVQNTEINSILIQEINKLSGEHKEVLILRHIEDYSYADISEILNCSTGTVKSRIFRARNILREQLIKIEVL